LRIGFQYEGMQEYHMIARGRNRDTTWYRMLDHEWPEVRARLETRLGLSS
jgi:RimJ/RimL family protein N-acetyltransferase